MISATCFEFDVIDSQFVVQFIVQQVRLLLFWSFYVDTSDRWFLLGTSLWRLSSTLGLMLV
jgi:hypothetical protein